MCDSTTLCTCCGSVQAVLQPNNLPRCSPAPGILRWVALSPCCQLVCPGSTSPVHADVCCHPGGRVLTTLPALLGLGVAEMLLWGKDALYGPASFCLVRLSCFPAWLYGWGLQLRHSRLLFCSLPLSRGMRCVSWGAAFCFAPPSFAGVTVQQGWRRQMPCALWRQTGRCVHYGLGALPRGTCKADVGVVSCWRSCGPSLPPVCLWSGVDRAGVRKSVEVWVSSTQPWLVQLKGLSVHFKVHIAEKQIQKSC